MSRRALAFALLLSLCVLAGGAAVVVAALRGGSVNADASVLTADLDVLPSTSRILVRGVDPSSPRLNGVIERLHPDTGSSAKVGSGLACERFDLAAGHGVCLAVAASGVDYVARMFDRDFRLTGGLPLTGLPSRVRVSPDGRYAAVTVFATGHSYTTPGQFSTRTDLIHPGSGARIADLEAFRVTRNGSTIHAIDFNFWGVTFEQDSDRFYATLATGNHHYLVRGSVRDRIARVVADDVECPSLSPDNRQIGFKQPLGGGRWRFSVLDLATGKRWPLAEERSIDDQVEWLDNERLLYGDGTAVWVVRADGRGTPVRVASNADSPVVVAR